MKIPKSFRLMGREWHVVVIPKSKWLDDEDAVAICDFKICEIRVRRDKRDGMEHALLHEYMHACLSAMGHKLTTDESFVDNLAGLLHQILVTAE